MGGEEVYDDEKLCKLLLKLRRKNEIAMISTTSESREIFRGIRLLQRLRVREDEQRVSLLCEDSSSEKAARIIN